MEAGAKVEVTIPVAWTPAFLDNNDGVDSPGESSLVGAQPISSFLAAEAPPGSCPLPRTLSSKPATP